MEDNLTEFEGSQVQGLDVSDIEEEPSLQSLNYASEESRRLNESRLEIRELAEEDQTAILEEQEEAEEEDQHQEEYS